MARGKKRIHKNKRTEDKPKPAKYVHEKTALEKVLGVASLVLLIVSFLVLAIMWSRLPQELPTHYDLYGQPDKYGDKANLLLLPCLALAVYLVVSLCQRMGPKAWNIPFRVPDEKKEEVYPILYTVLALLKIECVAITLLLNLATIFSFALPSWSSATILLLFATLGLGLYAAWQKSKF